MNPTKLVYEIGGWPRVSGVNVRIVLDPEERRVYSVWAIGAGIPMSVYLRTERVLLSDVNPDIVPGELEAWLREHEDEVEAIADCYRGSEWDGSNHRGRWGDALTDVEFDLESAWYSADLPAYWEAGDYLGYDVNAWIDEALKARTIELAAKAQVSDAQANGAWLRQDDTEEAITSFLESAKEALEDAEGDDRDEQRLGRINALLETA